jgi:hypothetical protein
MNEYLQVMTDKYRPASLKRRADLKEIWDSTFQDIARAWAERAQLSLEDLTLTTSWDTIRHEAHSTAILKIQAYLDAQEAESVKRGQAIYKARVQPGETISIYANQGYRDARVLAVINNEALIEYSMPQGTTSLRIINAYQDEETAGRGRKMSYFNVPTKWLQAMCFAEIEWDGNPQQTRRNPSSARAMLEARRTK